MRLSRRLLRPAAAGLAMTMVFPSLCRAEPYEARVAVPVADLRREPSKPESSPVHDPLEESQLLYGDPVRVLEEKEGWARVEVIEQPEYTHHERWEGYPGWMQSSDLVRDNGRWSPNLVVTVHLAFIQPEPNAFLESKTRLSLGTRLQGTLAEDSWKLTMLDGSTGWIGKKEASDLVRWEGSGRSPPREPIVRAARSLLGNPYYWGGRSAYDQGTYIPHTGVDCSGLVGLAYQANGVPIPRDAHEQWMGARAISREELRPADLIFMADEKTPFQIKHVMLYAGGGRVIEGPGTGERIREVELETRLKDAQASGRRVDYGTYF